VLQVGLTMDRSSLYAQVDRRVDWMLAHGLEDEVRLLVDKGYSFRLPAMSGLGYAQFEPYFDGRASLEAVVSEIKRATRTFIRRQYNWFRLTDPDIRWLDVAKTEPGEAASLVARWLGDQAAL
jgi:tRNA dimethylallyltransferase